MAKLAFSKLGLKQNNDVVNIEFNGQIIEVKQYLPIETKLELITNTINFSTDENNNFTNPIKVKVYMILEIIEKYTNINFTEKQKSEPTKLYDLVFGNGLVENILKNIPEKEYSDIVEGINNSIEVFDKYKNSFMGFLENLSSDYKAVDLDLSNIQNKIADPQMFATIKELANFSGLIN